MKKQFLQFILRWILNSFGLWVAAHLLRGHGFTYNADLGLSLFLWTGLVLSLVNVILKPIIVILSLPAILLTLGLFTLIVNGFMVYLATTFVGISVTFWTAVLAGMIISLINYVLTNLLDFQSKGRI